MNKLEIIIADQIDLKNSIHPKDMLFFIWDEFLNNKKFVSIPFLVEENASFYRSVFLKWLDEFTLQKINNIPVYDHLKLKDGMPFWWTTSLGQRFNKFAKSKINDVIKSMAMIDYLEEKKITPISIKVISKKSELILFLKQFAESKNIPFESKENPTPLWKRKSTIIYALFLFRHVVYSFFLKKNQRKNCSKISFFDIFTHLREGPKFQSNYWTNLVSLLQEKKVNVQWNHLYYRSKTRFSFIKTINRNSVFNKTSTKEHQHAIIEQDFTLGLFLKTLKRYFYVRSKSKLPLTQISYNYPIGKRNISFAPFLQEQFEDSLQGQEALKNCFYSILIENVVEKTPLDAKGVYLQEFQSWEIALTHYWKKKHRNTLIAVPHSAHAFWDLRYFFGKNSFLHLTKDILPDIIAVNGDYAYNLCVEGGYPKTILKKVEALRYLHHPEKPLLRKNTKKKIVRILICCDYQLSTSKRLFKLVNKVIKKSDLIYAVSVRMHPAFPLPSSLIKKYKFKICNKEMVSSLQSNDWIITSNQSAITVDAFYQGCNIAQLNDGLYFNLSPLRGILDDVFFNNSKDLFDLLTFENKKKTVFSSYFMIKSSLRNWSKLLSIDDF